MKAGVQVDSVQAAQTTTNDQINCFINYVQSFFACYQYCSNLLLFFCLPRSFYVIILILNLVFVNSKKRCLKTLLD